VRHQVKSLAYLDIGVDNGGIVLNISEIGLAVHAVNILPPKPIVDIRLQLHRSATRLETRAKVVWTSDTKKEAGIEFVDLPENVRLEIKEWLALENLEPLFVARGLRLESPPAVDPSLTRRTARSDKWTNLVSELTSIPAGIDRVVESSRPSAYTGKATESMPLKEAVAPFDLVSILAGEESDTHTPPKDFDLSALVLTDSKQSNLESGFITADPADLLVSPNPSANGNMPYRKSDAQLSLPSDQLLASLSHSGAFPANQENKTSANGSRNHQEPDSSAVHGDDFLKKTRELFGTNGVARNEPEAARDNSPIFNLVGAGPAKLRSEDNSRGHGLAPTSSLIATPALSGEAPIPSLLWPITSARLNADVRLEESKHSSTASPERSLDLRSFVGLFALCVLLSVACLALGIVVGRSVATHSPDTSGSSDSTPSLAAPADVQSNKVSHQPASNTTTSRALKKKSALEAASHRIAMADRPSEDTISPQTGSDELPAGAATDRSAVQGDSETLSPTNASSNGASITPLPAAPVSATAPAINPSVPPNLNAALRTQPAADRLVAAHLIYRVEPFYPKEALQQRTEGTVKIHATVGQDGRVENLRVVSGPDSLTSAALSAAQYWRYVPALRNGEPIESEEDISIEFHLLH
jgi:periplasmic protein TonB